MRLYRASQTLISQRTPLASIPGSARPMRCRKCWAPSPSVASICSPRAHPTHRIRKRQKTQGHKLAMPQSLKNDQMSDGVGCRRRRGCSVFIRPTTAPSKIQQRCIIKPLNFDKLALRGPRKIFLSSPMKLSKYFHNVSKCQTNPCLMDYHIVVAPLLRLSPFCNWRPVP